MMFLDFVSNALPGTWGVYRATALGNRLDLTYAGTRARTNSLTTRSKCSLFSSTEPLGKGEGVMSRR